MRRFMRRVCAAPDALVPPMETFRGTGAALSDPELARILEKDELGTWALDVASIEVLWEKLQSDRPAAVLEFGAGVSTIMLARHAQWRATSGAERPIIISLEQDAGVREKVEQRLASLELHEGIHVLHAPLSETSRYRIDLDQVKQRLNGRAVEWVLIDGPAGPQGCRDTTLPDVMPLCRDGARWFLDDALRDGELAILRQWSRLRGVEVEGIYPIGKGLATGRLWQNS
jgi:predicted O-methyltransferase YrrM